MTANIPVVTAANWSGCFDCGDGISPGDEVGAADIGRSYRVPVCMDCRAARINEGDI